MRRPEKSQEQVAQEIEDLHQRVARAEAATARAEAALQQSEARFQAFLDNSPCVAFLKDPAGRLMYGNAGMERLFSSKDRLFLGRTDYELFPNEIAEKIRENDAKVLATRQPLETIEVVPDSKGTLRSWLVMKFPVPDESGDLLLGGVAVDITEHRRVETELRHSEELQRRIIETVPGGIVTVGLDGSIRQANQEAQNILGLSWHQMSRRFVQDWEPETIWEDGSVCLAADYPVSRCLATGQPQPPTTIGVRHPNGQIAWAIYTAVPITELQTGQPTGAVVTFLDITERLRLEQSHRQGEERMRLALDAGNMVTWEWNFADDRLDNTSRQSLALYGFADDDSVTFESWLARLHPEDRSRLKDRLRNILVTPGDNEWREEFRIIHPQLGERWLFGLGRCIRDDSGRSQRMVGVNYDITERKQVEIELHQKNAILQSILDSMAEGVVVANENGRILVVNRAADQVGSLGDIQTNPDEWTEHYSVFMTDGVTPFAADQVPLTRTIRGEDVEATDMYLMKKRTGKGRWLNVTGRPLRDKDGSHRGGVVVFRDVTERRLSEEKLKEHALQLQALSHRLLHIQEEERRHLARELHDEVGQALTGLKLLFERESLAKHAHSSEVYANAIKLIQDLMVRVRCLSMHLRPTLLDDFGLVTSLRWHTRQYTEQTGVHVNLDLVGLKEGDRLAPELEIGSYRIVQEALTNVARHTHVNEVIVQVRKENELLLVKIQDQGPGFNPNHSWASSGISGMRERATLLGGTLIVQSRPGAGTQVSARLPVGGHHGGSINSDSSRSSST